jgi:hypothetical protein
MRDIEDADAGFLSFVSEIKNAASIGPLLDGQSLAAIAIAIEIVVADEDYVVGFRRGWALIGRTASPTTIRMRFNLTSGPL